MPGPSAFRWLLPFPVVPIICSIIGVYLFCKVLVDLHPFQLVVYSSTEFKEYYHNETDPQWLVPGLVKPIENLLTNGGYLRLYSTETLFKSYDLSQAVQAIEDLDPGNLKSFVDFQNYVRYVGHETNHFVHNLDRCLYFLTDDTQQSTWPGTSVNQYDEHNFYYDALNACQTAQAMLLQLAHDNYELPKVLNNLTDITTKLLREVKEANRNQNLFAYRFRPKGKRNVSREKWYSHWLDYLEEHESRRMIPEAARRILLMEASVADVVSILKAATGGRVDSHKYSDIAKASEPLFKMLAFKYALTDRKYKIGRTATA